MKQIVLIFLVIMAICTVQTQRLRNAVIYLGVFSLSMSFVYVLYNAPDVAIAEAVIGSTLATILYLVALQKYKMFTIFFHVHSGEVNDGHYTHRKHSEFIKLLEVFCAKQELEPQIIYTTDEKETIMEHHRYSVIIEDHDGTLTLYGHPENIKIEVLESFLMEQETLEYPYKLICEVCL